MGACCSKQQDLYIDVPRLNSTADTWALRQKSFVGGCKLLPFTASCPASFPYQSLTRVILGEDHLFAAVWEGHGGSQAARHCVSKCYETLLECMKANPDPAQAFKRTTQQLDKTYFASDLPDIVKAGVGATGVMIYINTRNNQCYVARMGDNLPFVTESKGSFNTTTVDVKPLSSKQSHRVLFSDLADRSGAGAAYAVSDPDGPSTYTHAIGLGFGKDKKLQQLWLKQEGASDLKKMMGRLPFISSDCEAREAQLSQGDETIILASEGLLEVLPAHEIGLFLHHFNAAKLQTLRQTLTATAAQQEEMKAATLPSPGAKGSKAKGKGKAADKENQGAASKAPAVPNVASILMHHALSKVVDQFNVIMERDHQASGQQEAVQKLTYQELTQLPLVVDKEAFRPAGSKGSQVQLHLPKHYKSAGLCKRDVHGDMGMVVISLSWPRSQESQPLPGLSPLRSGRAIKPDAQYRWQLLRASVKFYTAYRRSLRSRWWQLVTDAEVAAGEAARQKEVQAWKTKGEAVKVSLAGQELDPDTPTRVRHSPAKTTPMHSSPMKRSGLAAENSASRGIGSGRVAAAVAAFSTPPASKPASRSAGGSRIPSAPGTGPSAAGSSSSSTRVPAADTVTTPSSPFAGAAVVRDDGLQQRQQEHDDISDARSAVTAPVHLQVGTYEIGTEDSDIDSPKLDSPSKSASKQPFAVQLGAKRAAAGSPSKLHGKQNLSLRGSRTPALSAEGSVKSIQGRDSNSPAPTSESSWPSFGAHSGPAKQLRGVSKGGSSGGGAAADTSKRAAGSPAKSGRTPPSMSKETSSSGVYGHGSGASRGGSPSKMNRAGRISLRTSKPAAYY